MPTYAYRIVAGLVLALLISSSVFAEATTQTFRTRSYQIVTDTNLADAKEIGAYMDTVYAE